MNFFKRYAAYFIAATFGVAAILAFVVKVDVPIFAWDILIALGLGTVRLAIQDVSGNVGWKSYAAAGIVFVVGLLKAMGLVIPEMAMDLIYSAAGILGLSGIKAAIAKLKRA